MDKHRARKLLDQVSACPERFEGMPSASNTIPIAPSRPTPAGSNAPSTSTACVTRLNWAIPRSKPFSPCRLTVAFSRSRGAKRNASPLERRVRRPCRDATRRLGELTKGLELGRVRGADPSRKAKVTCGGVGAGGGATFPQLRDDGRQGRRYQHRWTVVVLRCDATHRSNTGGACGGSVRPDVSKVSPS